jgi:DNA primase
MNWLSQHLSALTLREEQEGYFLGRGAKDESIARFGIRTWDALQEPIDDALFVSRYGSMGERLEDWMVWPLLSPRGRVIGIEGRHPSRKEITRYMLPQTEWFPVFTGMLPDVMERIWQGGDIWIVEGIFDLFPLEWVVPAKDVVLATQRARLTAKHIEFLRRFARQSGQYVRMVYDNDETGRKGVHDWVDDTGRKRWGGLRRLGRVGVKALEVKYSGKDPGDVWSKGGLSAMKRTFGV